MVKKVVAAHDVGRAVNPRAVEGQIEGGIAMGLGYALREKFPLEKLRSHGQIRYPGAFPLHGHAEVEVILIGKMLHPSGTALRAWAKSPPSQPPRQ